MNITIQDMEAKILKVQEDLKNLAQTGSVGRQSEVLREYLEYLQDELKMMKDEANKKAPQYGQSNYRP